MDTVRRFELACCSLLLAVAGALGWAAWRIEPGPFDPIGSGRIPLVLSILLVALALGVVLRPDPSAEAPDEPEAAGGPARPGIAVLLTVAFAVAFSEQWLPFVPMSAGYLLLVGLTLSEGWPGIRRVLGLLTVAVILPSVMAYLFTHVFYVRLP